MRKLLLIILLGCAISNAASPASKPNSGDERGVTQPRGTPSNPFFVERKETDDDKAANADEVKDRKENLVIQTTALKVAVDALKVTTDASDAATLAANVGKVVAFIAGLQVLMFGWQLWVMRQSNKTAADAAGSALENVRLTEKLFVASHRPWIEVEVTLADDLKRDGVGGWAISLDFKMTNVGSTPAQNVWPHPELYAGEGFTDEVKKAQLKLAAEFKPVVDSNLAGLTIFPGKFFRVPICIHLAKEVAEDPVLTYAELGYGDCLPKLFIVGSVHYKSTLGEIPHRTGFIKAFGYVDVIQKKTTLIPKRGTISRSDLELAPHISGDGHID